MPRVTALVFSLLLLAACAGEPPDRSPASAEPSAGEVSEAGAAADAPRACTAPSPDDGDTLTVVFFGDSLTAGFGLADPSTQEFPALVERRAHEAGLAVRAVNAGNSGETSAGGLSRIRWFLGGTRPDVFVLALGANDGLRGLDPAAMQANLEGILACVREAAPEALLVVAGMEALPNLGGAYGTRFRAVFPAVAEAAGATLLPFLLEGVGGRPELNQGDGVHPTAEGQRVMAETMWRTLAPVLREAPRRS
jgi:acyl-CoA thioesterase-1